MQLPEYDGLAGRGGKDKNTSNGSFKVPGTATDSATRPDGTIIYALSRCGGPGSEKMSQTSSYIIVIGQ